MRAGFGASYSGFPGGGGAYIGTTDPFFEDWSADNSGAITLKSTTTRFITGFANTGANTNWEVVVTHPLLTLKPVIEITLIDRLAPYSFRRISYHPAVGSVRISGDTLGDLANETLSVVIHKF